MLSRRSVVFAAIAASAAVIAPAFATETDFRSGILRGGAEGRQVDLGRDPRLLVSDL